MPPPPPPQASHAAHSSAAILLPSLPETHGACIQTSRPDASLPARLSRAGRLYRSGNPAAASLSDVALLRGDLGITHMLDFRSAEEQSEDRGWPLVLSNGVIRTYDARGKLAEVAVEGAEEVALAGLHLPRCELHRLSLLEKDRFVWGLVMRLPVFSVFKALAYRLLGWHDAMRDVLVP